MRKMLVSISTNHENGGWSQAVLLVDGCKIRDWKQKVLLHLKCLVNFKVNTKKHIDFKIDELKNLRNC